MTIIEIYKEVKANPGLKSKVCVCIYRLANQYNNKNILLRLMSFVFIFINKVFNEFFLTVEIPYRTKIGKGFIIWHAHSIVINVGCIIGEGFQIRQNCTCGANKLSIPKRFIMGDNVVMGANSCVLSDNIIVGDNVIIGAGVVLMNDVEKGHYVIGNKPIVKVLN